MALKKRRVRRRGSARPIVFPWFVLGFLAVIVAQSFYRPAAPVRAALIEIDTVLLASAMFALGLGTRWEQMKKAAIAMSTTLTMLRTEETE